MYVHGLYDLHVGKQYFPKSPKCSWWQIVHTSTDAFAEATEYSDYLKVGEQWISLTGFSLTLTVWSQEPPEVISDIAKIKTLPGGACPPTTLV